jgi:hypothetical protein
MPMPCIDDESGGRHADQMRKMDENASSFFLSFYRFEAIMKTCRIIQLQLFKANEAASSPNAGQRKKTSDRHDEIKLRKMDQDASSLWY